jgi:hypothetical protein
MGISNQAALDANEKVISTHINNGMRIDFFMVQRYGVSFFQGLL